MNCEQNETAPYISPNSFSPTTVATLFPWIISMQFYMFTTTEMKTGTQHGKVACIWNYAISKILLQHSEKQATIFFSANKSCSNKPLFSNMKQRFQVKVFLFVVDWKLFPIDEFILFTGYGWKFRFNFFRKLINLNWGYVCCFNDSEKE